jgi:hypothetical protein
MRESCVGSVGAVQSRSNGAENHCIDWLPGAVFENSCGAKNSEVADPVDFWKKKGEIRFMCERNSNLTENQNSAAFTDNSAKFIDNSAAFTDNSVIFEKPHFSPLRNLSKFKF